MKIVTADEMRQIDRSTSERFGVPSLTLMENAGTAVADFILEQYPEAKTVGVVCGKGNNGGDGFVCARRLRAAGKKVSVLLLAAPAELRGDAAAMFKKMKIKPVVARSEKQLAAPAAQRVFQCDLLVDALLGTGFKPPVKGLYAQAIDRLCQARKQGHKVVAVDIPSGMDSDAAAPAGQDVPCDAVVTFTAPKLAHVFALPAETAVVVAPIGSPPEAITSQQDLEVITARDFPANFFHRDAEANKGRFGHVLVIGGSLGKAGAAALAGLAAVHMGAGLTTVATAKYVLPTVAGFSPVLMTEPLAETDAGSIALAALDYGRLDAILKGKTVIALGPGISRHPDTAQFVRAVVERYELPLVLDADGLNTFEGCAEKLDGRKRPLVLTPHPGEMARLIGKTVAAIQQDRVGTARRFAAEHRCVVVLKGHRTVVAEPGGTAWINPTGNPGMASGGTGDVLTGMIAACIAQHPSEVLRATIAAVYLHGLTGDHATHVFWGPSVSATEVMGLISSGFGWARELSTSRFVHMNIGEPRRPAGPSRW